MRGSAFFLRAGTIPGLGTDPPPIRGREIAGFPRPERHLCAVTEAGIACEPGLRRDLAGNRNIALPSPGDPLSRLRVCHGDLALTLTDLFVAPEASTANCCKEN
ncbi:hypothetical protein GWI33_018983 [Rhynchophorus ferrugineus]|uniref:Uncharacterized protein n=1 Tax=Rhynchophorus ferrugineus TaxID=354439 RepID=A0A834M1T6_RHYFE|nr:hypothetical protein GWI33_018983 [Rhynchophorus ferrugineus]